jgi:hypothetical protein
MGLGTEPAASLSDFTMPPAASTAGAFGNDFASEGLPFQTTGMGDEFAGESFPWEMVGLGLEEPLPAQDTIDDLYATFLRTMREQTDTRQASYIFRQGTPFLPDNTSTSLSCNMQLEPPNAPSDRIEICDVDNGSIGNRQI